MGITAIGALVGGAAVAEGAVAVSTLAMVGAGLSAVGMVTGNKTLSQLGMGAGLASLGGSIYNWSQGEIAMNGAQNSLDNMTAMEGSAGPQASSATDFSQGMASGTNAGNVATSGTGAAVDATGTVVAPGAASAANGAAVDTGLTSSGSVGAPVTTSAPSGFSTSELNDFNNGSLSQTTAAGSSATNFNGGIAQQIADSAAKGGSNLTQWFNTLSPDSKAHVVAGVLQGGGGLLGGVMNGWSASQKLALEQLQNSQEWQKYQTSMKNMNSPAAVQFAKPAGIINSAQTMA